MPTCARRRGRRHGVLPRTFKLKSNQTGNYPLKMPGSFKPITDATAIGYPLYHGNRSATASATRSRSPPQGPTEPFLGATILRGRTRNGASVTVKTGRVNNMTLQL